MVRLIKSAGLRLGRWLAVYLGTFTLYVLVSLGLELAGVSRFWSPILGLVPAAIAAAWIALAVNLEDVRNW